MSTVVHTTVSVSSTTDNYGVRKRVATTGYLQAA
jgi:hypothetical protein